MSPPDPQDRSPHEPLSWSGWSLEDTLPQIQAVAPIEEPHRTSTTGRWVKVSSLGVTVSAVFSMISAVFLIFGPERQDDLLARRKPNPKPDKPRPKPRGRRTR